MTDILDPKKLNLGTKPKISEGVLKSVLPDFISNMVKPIAEQNKEAYNKLYDIIKTEYTRVDVVDEDGGVLFWMPPLRYMPKVSNQDLSGFHSYAEAVAKRAPGKADAMIGNMLQTTLLNIDIPDEDVKQWAFILERYGYNLPDKYKNTSTEPEVNKTADSFEVIDDDDEW